MTVPYIQKIQKIADLLEEVLVKSGQYDAFIEHERNPEFNQSRFYVQCRHQKPMRLYIAGGFFERYSIETILEHVRTILITKMTENPGRTVSVSVTRKPDYDFDVLIL